MQRCSVMIPAWTAHASQVFGEHGEALRWWRRAAKAGDVEGMFKLGFAKYKGGDEGERTLSA